MFHDGQTAGGSRPHPGRSADGRKPWRLPQHTVNRTRADGVWFAAAVFAVILMLLIFIL